VELLDSAERSLRLSTCAFFNGPRAFEVLARRMDQAPELRVTLLLNVQRGWGVSRPSVLYDPRALELEAPGGVLHAKAVVADEETVFVMSANLTEAAFERNIEAGLLLRDRALAGSMATHIRGLIDGGLLIALPGE